MRRYTAPIIRLRCVQSYRHIPNFLTNIGRARRPRWSAFLQSQGQTQGTQSYGLVVDLFVAYYKAELSDI